VDFNSPRKVRSFVPKALVYAVLVEGREVAALSELVANNYHFLEIVIPKSGDDFP
jgi:hypothetical protein